MKLYKLRKLQQKKLFIAGRYLVGIDPAKAKHQAQILDPDGLPVGSAFTTSYSASNHRLWQALQARLPAPLAALPRHEFLDHLVFAVEASCNLWPTLIDYLEAQHGRVVMVSPLATCHAPSAPPAWPCLWSEAGDARSAYAAGRRCRTMPRTHRLGWQWAPSNRIISGHPSPTMVGLPAWTGSENRSRAMRRCQGPAAASPSEGTDASKTGSAGARQGMQRTPSSFRRVVRAEVCPCVGER